MFFRLVFIIFAVALGCNFLQFCLRLIWKKLSDESCFKSGSENKSMKIIGTIERISESFVADKITLFTTAINLAKMAHLPGNADKCINLINYCKLDVNYISPSSGLSIFLASCASSNYHLIQQCLKFGGDVNAKSVWGDSPLYVAVHVHLKHNRPYFVILQLLIEAGCDLNSVNKYGYTALHLAIAKGDVDLTTFLLINGACAFKQTILGSPFLMARDTVVCAISSSNTMENYTKGEVVEIDEKLPFSWLSNDVIHMKVKGGSRINNILGYAISHFKEEECRNIIFSGVGNSISKSITCVEIMKRKFKNLQQVNKIQYKTVEEYWEPKNSDLDRLKVTRELPAIYTLLSKDELKETKPTIEVVNNSKAVLDKKINTVTEETNSSVAATFGRRQKRKKRN